LAGRGFDRAEIEQILLRSSRRVRPQEAARFAAFAERWGARIAADMAVSLDRRPPRSWLMRNPHIDDSYRYHVDFDFGEDSFGNSIIRSIIIDSPNQLTYREIFAEAMDVFLQSRQASPGLRDLNPHDAQNIQFIHGERRSG